MKESPTSLSKTVADPKSQSGVSQNLGCRRRKSAKPIFKMSGNDVEWSVVLGAKVPQDTDRKKQVSGVGAIYEHQPSINHTKLLIDMAPQ